MRWCWAVWVSILPVAWLVGQAGPRLWGETTTALVLVITLPALLLCWRFGLFRCPACGRRLLATDGPAVVKGARLIHDCGALLQ